MFIQLLKNIIKILHLVLIIYIIIAPFSHISHLYNSIILLGYILFNWKVMNCCMLTKLEYILSNNKEVESGFIYRLINPFYKLDNEKVFNIQLEKLTMSWFIILIITYIYS
jgi:hypothetical protein